MSYKFKRIKQEIDVSNYQFGEYTYIMVLPFKTLKKSCITIKEFQIYLDLCYYADMDKDYYRVVMY